MVSKSKDQKSVERMTIWKRKQRFPPRRGTINDKRGTKFIEEE
jgi:hypothetical protein